MLHHNYNSYLKNTNIVDYASGDVNGDKIDDNIFLTGMPWAT